jgi:flagellin-like hook-associated protein FlgL
MEIGNNSSYDNSNSSLLTQLSEHNQNMLDRISERKLAVDEMISNSKLEVDEILSNVRDTVPQSPKFIFSDMFSMADTTLSDMNNQLTKMRGLGEQSALESTTSEEREFLNTEANDAVKAIDTLSSLEIEETKLLDGSSTSLADASVSNLFSNTSIDMTTQESARVSLDTISNARIKIIEMRTELEAPESNYDAFLAKPVEQNEDTAKIRDANIETEVVDLFRPELKQAETAELSTANKTGMGKTLDLFS